MSQCLQCCHVSGVPSRRLRRRSLLTSPITRRKVRDEKIVCQSEPRLQRPKAPTPKPEVPTSEETPTLEPPRPPSTPSMETEPATTLEFQRRQAKAMVKYFEGLKFQEAAKQPVFGWTLDNEIGNGRWVMFGLLVGLLTEYATGVNIVDQIKLMVSNLGIADIYE